MASVTSLSRRYRYTTGSPTIRIYPEAASAVFKYMEPVNLTSGKVQRIATTTSSITTTDGVLGFALMDASGTTNTDVPVLLATDELEVSLPVIHGTAASAVTAITNIGVAYCLSHTSTGGQYAYQISVTTNGLFEVSEIDAEYAVGTQYGWAWGRIIEAGRVVA